MVQLHIVSGRGCGGVGGDGTSLSRLCPALGGQGEGSGGSDGEDCHPGGKVREPEPDGCVQAASHEWSQATAGCHSAPKHGSRQLERL